jgi:hypothetical protein
MRLVGEDVLGKRNFSLLNFFGFSSINIFLFLPGIIFYCIFCMMLYMEHSTDGFIVFHSDHMAMRQKTLARAEDQKNVHLFPMVHIGQSDFYKKITESFPTNSVVLTEGVTDEKNHLKTKLTYKNIASSLGLKEQAEVFSLKNYYTERADLDIDDFAPETILVLEEMAILHSKPLSISRLILFISKMEKSPQLSENLWYDLLTKRNNHLLNRIDESFEKFDAVVVPWGAMHMPGVSEELQNKNFKITSQQEYPVWYYRALWNRLTRAKSTPDKDSNPS